jgi:hypothetical protein
VPEPEHDHARAAENAPAERSHGSDAGDPGGPAGAILSLQAAAGNAAVSRMLQRQDSSGGVASPAAGSTAPGDQSSAGGPARTGPPDFKKLIEDKDTSGIRQVEDFGPATEDQRVAMITSLLQDTWWVGGSDRIAIKKIWEAWGPKGITGAFANNEALWDRCVDKDVDMAGLEALKDYRDKFGRDVKAVAALYMDKNSKAVKAEVGRLNLGHVDDIFKVGGEAPAPGKEIAEVQQLAREIQRADDALAALYKIPVGTMEVSRPVRKQGTSESDRSSGGGVPPAGADEQASNIVEVLFTPDKQPASSTPVKGREKEFRSHEQVLAEFKRVNAAKAAIASKSPSLFSLSQGKDGEAGKLAEMDPHQAQVQLGRMLNDTQAAIERAGPMIETEKINWREFTPIHEQLWSGMPGESTLKWDSKLAKLISKKDIGDYQATEFWRALGLTGLAAAAFIVSEIASLGMATVIWAAASATQAGFSIAKAEELNAAAKTATSKETRLVSSEQVDEAQAAAVLDAVFAFIDAVAVVKGAAAGVKAAARLSAREGLGKLAQLEKGQAREAIGNAVKELGPNATLRGANMPADEVIKLAGGEATAEGKALKAASTDAAVRPAGAGLDSIPRGVPTELGRRLAAQAQAQVYDRWAALGTPKARLQAMVDLLNPEIEAMGARKLGSNTPAKLLLEGEMDAPQWNISILSSMLDGAQPTHAQFEGLWGLVSHEFEHGKQWFQAAQVEAIRSPGKSAADIAAMVGIPDDIAQRAIDVQSGKRTGVRLVPGTPEFQQASRLHLSIAGPGRAPRGAVYDNLKRTSRELRAAEREWEGVKDLAETDPSHQAAITKWQDANAAYDTAELRYVQLPEEAAAYQAGAAHQASMGERFSMVRELETAKGAETQALGEMKRINGEMARLKGAGQAVPYPLKQEFWAQFEKANEQLRLIEEATENLGKAASGQAP